MNRIIDLTTGTAQQVPSWHTGTCLVIFLMLGVVAGYMIVKARELPEQDPKRDLYNLGATLAILGALLVGTGTF